MLDSTQPQVAKRAAQDIPSAAPAIADLPLWEQPKLEEVSEQVMAQPYIRFT
jgi:hypothetical protein